MNSLISFTHLEYLTPWLFLQINDCLEDYRCFFRWSFSESFMAWCSGSICTQCWLTEFFFSPVKFSLPCSSPINYNFRYRLVVNYIFKFFFSISHFTEMFFEAYTYLKPLSWWSLHHQTALNWCVHLHMLKTTGCLQKSFWHSSKLKICFKN